MQPDPNSKSGRTNVLDYYSEIFQHLHVSILQAARLPFILSVSVGPRSPFTLRRKNPPSSDTRRVSKLEVLYS